MASPSTRPGFIATRRFRGRTVRIEVKNLNRVRRGVKTLTLNGERPAGNLIPARTLRKENQVEVVLG